MEFKSCNQDLYTAQLCSDEFKVGQEVGLLKQKYIGPQTGTIMTITDDKKYHVLCRAIFPHQWVVYICEARELLAPSKKSSYKWENLYELYSYGHIYKQSEDSFYLREAISVDGLQVIGSHQTKN